MTDKNKDRRMTSGIGNTTTTRSFTLDRFEQEVASEIGLDKNRTHVAGRQGTVGSQTATGSGKHAQSSSTTTSEQDTQHK